MSNGGLVLDRLFERAGVAAGAVLAPVTGGISALRRARMFHPRGRSYVARVTKVARASPWGPVAERLDGYALVRFSGALFKQPIGPDVLGCAIRFTRTESPGDAPLPDDQDLLLATILRPWTMALSPFTTRTSDYLANRYNAVSPFDADGAGITEWRVVPVHASPSGRNRDERLQAAVEHGQATLVLEAAPYRSAVDLARARGAFHPVVRLDLLRPAEVDDAKLRFDPFRAGRGIEPRGFIHALRVGTYRASQAARPA